MRPPLLVVIILVLGTTVLTPKAGAQVPGASTANPHGSLPEGVECSACHTVQAWTPLKPTLDFAHDRDTDFALAGRHETATCQTCHLDLRFDDFSEPLVAPTDCAFCHADVHQARFVEECVTCHTTTSFQETGGAEVHFRTSFPLTGAHLQISCATCHADDTGGVFSAADLEVDCIACHQDAYRSATSVDHEAAGYSQQCTACHSTLAWSDAPTFDHGSTSGGFLLLGAHQGLRCASCHQVPGPGLVFPTPTSQEDCIACHREDYDREHAGSGYPTTCPTCHTEDAWDSSFVHDTRYFPIFSGAHAGEWSDCATCHTVPQDFATFTCLTCHEHNQTDTDRDHSEVSGYVYESTRCLSCHADGQD